MNSSIVIGGFHIDATSREKKGHCIVDFPTDYCVLSVEATGRSPKHDEIIEIGAIRYSNDREIELYHTLTQPPECDDYYIDEFIEELTGITNDMLFRSPSMADAIQEFSQFLGESTIVGYCVDGDINFLYDKYMRYLDLPLTNNYVDVMRIAQRLHPEWVHYRLKDIMARYGMTKVKDHRSIIDCKAIQFCYKKLREEVAAQGGSVENCLALKTKGGIKTNPEWALCQKYCAIAGKLDRFSRAEAVRLISELGGIFENNVTQRTHYLLIGDEEYRRSMLSGKSVKQRKTEARKLEGQDIEIITESALYDMIADFLRD